MATLKDIAAEVGVSVPTVSLILSGKGARYRSSTRESVLRTARRLQYRADLAGRALREGRSFLLGTLVYGVNSAILSEFLLGVGQALSGHPYAPLVFSHDTAAEEKEHLRRCAERRVDGYIVNPSDAEDGAAAAGMYGALLRRRVPLVEVFGRMLPGAVRVNVDVRHAGRLQTEHLLDLGHRKIACLTHERYGDARTVPALHWDAWEMCVGYREALQAGGFTPVIVTHPVPKAGREPRAASGGWIDAGYAAAPRVKRLMTKGVTAAVCYNSLEAAGLVAGLASCGVDVPRQFSVTGGGDSEAAVTARPSLTCVRWPVAGVGRQAVASLLSLMAKREVKSIALPGELALRGSTGPVPR